MSCWKFHPGMAGPILPLILSYFWLSARKGLVTPSTEDDDTVDHKSDGQLEPPGMQWFNCMLLPPVNMSS